ncbi:MAG: GNAT family N-acetyltransferase [Burkholderiaceae bacterium]|nr:GNAT family N-acetyltransferase [Burkholderiaceae bacterium]
MSTPLNLTIRTGQLQDARQLAVLLTQVWLHTYANNGITEDIAGYVLSEFTPEKCLIWFNDVATQMFVAQQEEALVGVAILRCGVSCPAQKGLMTELQMLYVQEHFIGKGIGKRLLQAAENKAQSLANAGLWLTVKANNLRAIEFYAHQGYSKLGTIYFMLG